MNPSGIQFITRPIMKSMLKGLLKFNHHVIVSSETNAYLAVPKIPIVNGVSVNVMRVIRNSKASATPKLLPVCCRINEVLGQAEMDFVVLRLMSVGPMTLIQSVKVLTAILVLIVQVNASKFRFL